MNSQYYHHYNYCTLYIYILHRSFRTLATTQIHPLLSRASAMFTGQFHSTSMRMICRLPCDLRASYGNPLISRHLWTWSNGWFSTSSFYHWERDVLALCLLCPFWGDPGSPDMAISWRKKFGSTPDGSLKATAVFFAMCFATNQGSWQYSRSRSSFHNIRNLVCSNMQYIWIINQRGVAHHECYM